MWLLGEFIAGLCLLATILLVEWLAGPTHFSEWCLMPCLTLTTWILQWIPWWTYMYRCSVRLSPTNACIHDVKYYLNSWSLDNKRHVAKRKSEFLHNYQVTVITVITTMQSEPLCTFPQCWKACYTLHETTTNVTSNLMFSAFAVCISYWVLPTYSHWQLQGPSKQSSEQRVGGWNHYLFDLLHSVLSWHWWVVCCLDIGELIHMIGLGEERGCGYVWCARVHVYVWSV